MGRRRPHLPPVVIGPKVHGQQAGSRAQMSQLRTETETAGSGVRISRSGSATSGRIFAARHRNTAGERAAEQLRREGFFSDMTAAAYVERARTADLQPKRVVSQ
jgi:hypothetical protein